MTIYFPLIAGFIQDFFDTGPGAQIGGKLDKIFGADAIAHSGYVLIPAATLLFVVRGRSELRSIFFGDLTTARVLLVGVIGGLCCFAASLAIVVVDRMIEHDDLFAGLTPAFQLRQFSLEANVYGPIEEELMYQGAIQTMLQRRGPILAVVITSVLFTGAHFGNTYFFYLAYGELYIKLAFTCVQFFVSLSIFAIIRQRTKSLGAAIVAHMINNAIGSLIDQPS